MVSKTFRLHSTVVFQQTRAQLQVHEHCAGTPQPQVELQSQPPPWDAGRGKWRVVRWRCCWKCCAIHNQKGSSRRTWTNTQVGDSNVSHTNRTNMGEKRLRVRAKVEERVRNRHEKTKETTGNFFPIFCVISRNSLTLMWSWEKDCPRPAKTAEVAVVSENLAHFVRGQENYIAAWNMLQSTKLFNDIRSRRHWVLWWA